MAGEPGGKRNERSRDSNSDSEEDRPSTKRPHRSRDICFRLLVAARKIGAVIGKQGSKINSLRDETGARIKIADAVMGSDERVVIVSCSEDEASSAWSPAQEALTRLVDSVIEAYERDDVPSIDSSSYTTGGHGVRLLVAGSQAGSLIGKGGSTIKAIREETRASIRVLPLEELPMCALPADRVVSIGGEKESVKKAIQEVSVHLRENPPKDHPRAGDLLREHHMPPMAGMGHGQGGGRNPSNVRGRGPRSEHLGWGALEPLATLPDLLSHPAAAVAALGMNLGSFGGHHSSRRDRDRDRDRERGHSRERDHRDLRDHRDFDRGVSLAAITPLVQPIGASVTTNFTISSALAGSIIGKGGRNIAKIRQLSGARIRLNDAKDGGYERVVEITGSADQVGAAQGFIQAFLVAAQQGGAGGGRSDY